MVMDFDGSISTELALYNNKDEYDQTVTHGLPPGSDGEKVPTQVVGFGPTIPRSHLSRSGRTARLMSSPSS